MHSVEQVKERECMHKKNIMLKLADRLLRENLIAPDERNQLMRFLEEESDE